MDLVTIYKLRQKKTALEEAVFVRLCYCVVTLDRSVQG